MHVASIWVVLIVILSFFCCVTCHSQQILAPLNNEILKTNRPIQIQWTQQLPNSVFSLFYSQNNQTETIVTNLNQIDTYTWQVPLLDTTEVALVLQTISKDFLQPMLWWKNDSVVPNSTEIRKLFVSSTSDSFYFSTSFNTIEEWEIASSSRIRSDTFGLQTSSQASFSNDNFTLLSNDNMLYYIDRNTRNFSVKGFEDPHVSFIRDIAYSPTNDLLATASNDGTIKIRNLTSDQILTTISVPTITSMYSVSFSNDGQRIVFAGNDGAIYVSNLSTLPNYTQSAERHGSAGLGLVVWDCNFSTDDQRIVSGGVDGFVKVWDANDLSLNATLVGHSFHVRSAHFSPDNAVIASVGLDSTLLIFDATSFQLLYAPLQHSHALLDMKFFPDSKRIITAGRGRTVSIWQLPTETVVLDTVSVTPKYPISIYIPTIRASVGDRVSIPIRYTVQSRYPSFIDISLETSLSRFSFVPIATNWIKTTNFQNFETSLFNIIGTSSDVLPPWKSLILYSKEVNGDSLILSKLHFANTFFVIDTLQNGFVIIDSLCIQNPLYPTLSFQKNALTLLTSIKPTEIECSFSPVEIGRHHLIISTVDGRIVCDKIIDVTSNLDVNRIIIPKNNVPYICIISVFSPTEQIVQKVSSNK